MNSTQIPVNGILSVDKPQGWTSHDVCAFIRKKFKIKKVGHAGTLDPLATGLLVVLLGRATKLSMELSGNDKEYSGIMELGIKTDSHDRNGKVIAEASFDTVSFEDICRKVSESFTGEILQVPPMVSALKHKGKRLYELARKGVEVTRDSRAIHVHEFKILKKDGAFVHFSVKVSKGTYVRTLVSDLGESLGTFACLAALRRTRSGERSIDEAVTVEQLQDWTSEDLIRRMAASQDSHACP